MWTAFYKTGIAESNINIRENGLGCSWVGIFKVEKHRIGLCTNEAAMRVFIIRVSVDAHRLFGMNKYSCYRTGALELHLSLSRDLLLCSRIQLN